MNNILDKITNLRANIKKRVNLTKEDLRKIENDFRGIYEDLLLFLITKKDRYYGYILMNLHLEVDFYSDIIAGVKVVEYPLVLLINPFLFLEYEVREMLFILCHEIEHLVLNHPSEGIRINPNGNYYFHLRLNIAMDASINTRFIHENDKFIKIPDGSITLDDVKKISGKKQIKDLENFLYYYNLIKDKKIVLESKKKSIKSKVINDNLNHECGCKNVITINNYQGTLNHSFEEGIDSKLAKELVRELIRQANAAINDKD